MVTAELEQRAAPQDMWLHRADACCIALTENTPNENTATWKDRVRIVLNEESQKGIETYSMLSLAWTLSAWQQNHIPYLTRVHAYLKTYLRNYFNGYPWGREMEGMIRDKGGKKIKPRRPWWGWIIKGKVYIQLSSPMVKRSKNSLFHLGN
jgi:hypothetical protein